MLMVENFNLNSMQECTNSLKEDLKQTIVNQEVMFRKQVHELHRLYRIQKTLMKDFGWKEIDAYNFLWIASTPITSTPYKTPTQHSPLAKEEIFSGSPMVGSTQSENKCFVELNRKDYHSLQHRPFDLQLAADQYANHVGNHLLEKENGWDFNESRELKNQFHDGNLFSLEEVGLTLSIGVETMNKGNGKRAWYETTHSSHRVIDLEESNDMLSNEDAKSISTLSCAAPITGDKHDSRICYQSTNRVSTNCMKDLSHGFTVNYSLVDGSESYKEHNSSNQGFKERNGDIECDDMLTKEKPFASYESFGLDLNREQFEDSSYTDVTTAEVTENPNVVFSLPRRNGTRNKSPISLEFDCIVDDTSSGTKTLQSGSDSGGSNTFTGNQFPKFLLSKVAKTQSGEQYLRSSNSGELKHQCCNKKEESAGGGDVLIQRAAELLLHFSMRSSTSNQDSFTKGGSNEIEMEERNQPQHSLDSYESMVLKLTESSVDDYCVSSKPIEVIELDKKDSGIKLRRGRRLKDFQRDVLPGLASLSRHEIREDINIMETVIRSREYKRMRSKTADSGNWFAPVKSKRSRLSYVGRRCYS